MKRERGVRISATGGKNIDENSLREFTRIGDIERRYQQELIDDASANPVFIRDPDSPRLDKN